MNSFLKDVIDGLSARQKFLSSKYFYDAKGDLIFREIMSMPEYYLTGCELEILSGQSGQIGEDLQSLHHRWDVVELGPGDASKSIYLLKEFQSRELLNAYYPIDISANVIATLEKSLPQEIKGVKVAGLSGDYFDMIPRVGRRASTPIFVLFLGGNICNFEPADIQVVLSKLYDRLLPGDRVLMGFDLKKCPGVIQRAYDDAAGITARFNLNLLNRINRELHGNFHLENFEHYCSYEPLSGACRSFLVSLGRQTVSVADVAFTFEAGECIYMEISQKFSPEEIETLIENAGFRIVKYYFDERKWFTDVLLEKL